jgi:HTH-type transcriptional regulator, competence development regulator
LRPKGAPEEAQGPATFSVEIQTLRKLKGISQRRLAASLGIDFTYLSKLENGRAEPPSEETIRNLAANLAATELEAGFLTDRLLALAGKVPTELKARAANDHNFASAIRELTYADEAQVSAVRNLLRKKR